MTVGCSVRVRWTAPTSGRRAAGRSRIRGMERQPGCYDPPMLTPSLEQRLAQLARVIGETAPLWRPAPFYHPRLPWETDHPELAAALRALTDEAVEAYADDDAALRSWLASFLPAFGNLEPLLAFPLHDAPLPAPADRHAPSRDVPGRKWAQIERFAAAVLAQGPLQVERIVDWCGGKSHLGRLLAMHSGRPVVLYERDAALCAQADALARRDRVALEAVQGDVLALADTLPADSQVVALHACGDLHLHLLDLAGAAPVEHLALSPCCYHRTRHAAWHWRSPAGRASGLVLGREDLRLAVLESVTSAPRERVQARARQQGLLALLGWAQASGQPLASVAGLDWRRDEDVPANLRRLAQAAHLPLPDADEAMHLWTMAAGRAREVRAFELLRHAIRRPLEALLVIDMALGLEAQGYAVSLTAFCPRALTPRNLLLMARRS